MTSPINPDDIDFNALDQPLIPVVHAEDYPWYQFATIPCQMVITQISHRKPHPQYGNAFDVYVRLPPTPTNPNPIINKILNQSSRTFAAVAKQVGCTKVSQFPQFVNRPINGILKIQMEKDKVTPRKGKTGKTFITFSPFIPNQTPTQPQVQQQPFVPQPPQQFIPQPIPQPIPQQMQPANNPLQCRFCGAMFANANDKATHLINAH